MNIEEHPIPTSLYQRQRRRTTCLACRIHRGFDRRKLYSHGTCRLSCSLHWTRSTPTNHSQRQTPALVAQYTSFRLDFRSTDHPTWWLWQCKIVHQVAPVSQQLGLVATMQHNHITHHSLRSVNRGVCCPTSLGSAGRACIFVAAANGNRLFPLHGTIHRIKGSSETARRSFAIYRATARTRIGMFRPSGTVDR